MVDERRSEGAADLLADVRGRRADAGAWFDRVRREVRRGSDHEADGEADGVVAQIERLGLELLEISRLPRS